MLPQTIATKIEDHLRTRISKVRVQGGGNIARACIIESDKGESFFVKYGVRSVISAFTMFTREANGLVEIHNSRSVAVPEVLQVCDDFLLLEYIPPNRPGPTFWRDFGQQLAKMHRFTGDYFGYAEDNFIGASPQKNCPAVEGRPENWAHFYLEYRLRFQIELAKDNGRATSQLIKAFDRLAPRIEDLLKGSDEPPCLLHGDLWSGNYLCGPGGKAYLIDPAVYYGHREADLAMTKLFGGFAEDFYTAYRDEYPLNEGWELREGLYQLYHVLNHLNLFGSGYYHQSLGLIQDYL